jgi:maltose O-acetyltransferase
MITGEPYLGSDPELLAARSRARRICRAFGETAPDDEARRRELLEELVGKLGERVWIEAPFFVDYGSQTSIGDDVFINTGCVILDCAPVSIGDRALLGPNVQILTAHHPVDPEVRRNLLEGASPIDIGADTWIGGGVILCPGVKVGRGSTVGAGSVVTRDVPERVVAAGNPCRVLRRIP